MLEEKGVRENTLKTITQTKENILLTNDLQQKMKKEIELSNNMPLQIENNKIGNTVKETIQYLERYDKLIISYI